MTLLLKGNDPDPVYILRSGPQSVATLKFTNFGLAREEVLISGSQNGLIQIWNLKSRRVILKVKACQGQGILYADIIHLSEQDVIISHGRNGVVQFWCFCDDEWKVKKTFHVYEFGYCPIALYDNGCKHWLAYCSGGESQFSITSIDLEENSSPIEMKPDGKRGIVMHIKMFSREHLLYALVGYEDGSVCLWDIHSASSLYSKKIHSDPVMCLDVDALCSKFISGSADHTLHVVQIDQNLKFQDGVSHDSATSGFACACIRHDGRIVVCGGWDGKIRVFSWKKLKPLAILKYHTQIVNKICFSDTNLIAAASKDGRISIWNVYKDV